MTFAMRDLRVKGRASRVIPISARNGWTRASVSRGETSLCVPLVYPFADCSGVERAGVKQH